MRLIRRNKDNFPSREDLINEFNESTSEGFFIFDSNLSSLEMNNAALKFVGGSSNKVIGRDIKDLLPNMVLGARIETLHEVIRTGEPYRFREYLVDQKLGNRLYEVAAFRLGAGLGLVMLDISDRLAMAIPLSSDDNKSDAIQTVIHDPFLILDSSNQVLSANNAFYEHFNLKAKDILEEPIYAAGNSQWDIVSLHELLDHKLIQTGSVEDFEVKAYFSGLGDRTLKLNARHIFDDQADRLFVFIAIRDITELIKHRNSLRKLSEIFHKAPDPIIITDLNGEIIELNEEAVNLYGWSRSELIQKPFKSIIPPNSRGQYDALLQTVIAAHQVRDLEAEHWTKTGAILPINLTAVLLTNSEQENIGIVVYMKHVASQSQADKSLQRFRDMILLSNDPLIIMDLNGIIVEINGAAEATYGWSKGSIIGKSDTILVAVEDQKKYLVSVADCVAGKKVRNQDIRRVTKQGLVHNAMISMHLLADAKDQSNAIAIVAKHSSERDKASRSHDAMLKHFLEIEDAVIVANMFGEIVDLNAAAVAQYGWKKNDLVGKKYKAVLPVDQQKQADELIEQCKTGKVVKNIEIIHWSKSGVIMPVLVTMFQVLDSEEIPTNIVTISRNLDTAKGVATGISVIDMEMLFMHHVDSIVVEDLSGNVMTMNLAAEKMLGWKLKDLKGKPIKTVIPADQHKQHEKILLLGQNNVPILKMESKRWNKTGRVFPVAVSLIVLKDDEGKPTSIANITWDISDVKELELKQRALKQQLGQH